LQCEIKLDHADDKLPEWTMRAADGRYDVAVALRREFVVKRPYDLA
jgi:hypothetical protein